MTTRQRISRILCAPGGSSQFHRINEDFWEVIGPFPCCISPSWERDIDGRFLRDGAVLPQLGYCTAVLLYLYTADLQRKAAWSAARSVSRTHALRLGGLTAGTTGHRPDTKGFTHFWVCVPTLAGMSLKRPLFM